MRQSALLLGLRLATIGLRFALTIAVTSILGLSAMGVLALAIGAAGLVPSIVGGGLNYHLAREAVGHTPAAFAPIVRDRFKATLAALMLFFSVALPLYHLLIAPVGTQQWLIGAIGAAETLAMEQYLVLIGLRRAPLANLLVFVRSAAWVPVVALLIWAVPACRNIETVLIGWLIGHGAATAILGVWAQRRGMVAAWRTAPATGWVRRTLPHSWYIYLSDLGLAGMSFGDRFLVSALLGLQAAGTFGFYWSYANALQTLVLTAFVQPLLPDLLEQHRRDPAVWRHDVLARWRRLFGLCVAGGVVLGVGVATAVALAPAGRFPVAPLFAVVLMLAIGIRTASEFLSTALSSAGRNRSYAAANVAGVALMVLTVGPLSLTGGLLGAAIALALTALATMAMRMTLIRREPPKRTPA